MKKIVIDAFIPVEHLEIVYFVSKIRMRSSFFLDNLAVQFLSYPAFFQLFMFTKMNLDICIIYRMSLRTENIFNISLTSTITN